MTTAINKIINKAYRSKKTIMRVPLYITLDRAIETNNLSLLVNVRDRVAVQLKREQFPYRRTKQGTVKFLFSKKLITRIKQLSN